MPQNWRGLGERGVEDGDTHLLSGEVKVAVSLRLMAEGSHLDLVPLFGASSSHLHNTAEDFLGWVLLSLEFPLVRWLCERNCEASQCLSNQFAEKPTGVFCNLIGALDGVGCEASLPPLD